MNAFRAGDEIGILTPTNPPDEAHERLCAARADDYGYLLVSDTLCLVTHAETRADGVCEWTLHVCELAGAG